MTRITRKQVDNLASILCKELSLPSEPYAKTEDGRFKAQIGCIHINSQNGTNNVYQICNENGGCSGLAYGLTLRECETWLQAAITGVGLAKENV